MVIINSHLANPKDNWIYQKEGNYWVNLSTGEYRPNVTLNVMEGSQVLSPEEIGRRRKFWEKELERRKAAEEERDNRHRRFLWRSRNPHFIFVSTELGSNGLSSATLTRLLYLGTYLRYESERLWRTERTPLKRSDLPKVMQLSPALISGFWKEVSSKYVMEDPSGELSIPEKFMRRGRFSSGAGTYQRFYIKAVRDLYRKTPARQHKQLGYIFQMLPHINHEFNILCHNPMEQDFDKVSPITLGEFCSAIGYDSKNRARLLNAYAEITFPVDNHQERFCSFLSNGGNLDTVRIHVNPHILYRGDSYGQAETLGNFCGPPSFGETDSFCERGAKDTISPIFVSIPPC